MDDKAASAVHTQILKGLVENGYAPSNDDLAALTGMPVEGIQQTLEKMEAAHGLALHPGTHDVWVIPPFSLVPTACWVEGARGGWWAACIWCALGVCALAGGENRIHTRIAGESEELVIQASGSGVRPSDLWVHFPIPVDRAWDNVHRYCASNQVFRSHADVSDWCARHGYTVGDIQPLEKVQNLARAWYGGHLDPNWRKWTLREAAEIFEAAGFTDESWSLPEGDSEF